MTDLLRGWIKALNPPTLQKAIKKARDMEASTSISKFQSKGFPHKKDHDKKQLQRESHQPWNDSNKLDSEQLNDLSYKCSMKAKAKQLEYFSTKESASEKSDK